KIETVEYEASTSDDLGGDQVLINQRLRAALDPRKGLLPYIAEQAHGKLIETRHAGHKNAAGLAVCYDIPHAKKVAALLERITGKKPVLVTSLDDDSKLKIERFRKSKDFWIVSVQMISEGVDIRRLRVLLFATNIKTAMGFRQLTARVGTIDGKHDGSGYVYLPEDPDLLEHVRQMESEIRHEVGDDLPMFSKKKELPEKTFRYILETLESKVRGVVAVDASKAEKKEVLTASLAKQMERLRQDITGLAVDLARLNGQSSPQKVHAAWMQRGGKPQAQETVEGLRAKYLWLRQLVNIARQRKFYTQREKVF
ncbi:MAG: hypothetical protein ACE5I1_31305, partial [bacterium]